MMSFWFFIILKIIFIKNLLCGLNPVTNMVFNFVTKFILDCKILQIYYLNFIENMLEKIYIQGRNKNKKRIVVLYIENITPSVFVVTSIVCKIGIVFEQLDLIYHILIFSYHFTYLGDKCLQSFGIYVRSTKWEKRQEYEI